MFIWKEKTYNVTHMCRLYPEVAAGPCQFVCLLFTVSSRVCTDVHKS